MVTDVSEEKMSESSLLSSSSLETIWTQHRIGITFVAVILTITTIFFGVLILLKWLEAQRRRQEMQPQLQQQQQQRSRGSSTAADVERGGLLDADAARSATEQLKPGDGYRIFVIMADGRRLIVKLADVVRGAVSRPTRGCKQGEVVSGNVVGDDGNK